MQFLSPLWMAILTLVFVLVFFYMGVKHEEFSIIAMSNLYNDHQISLYLSFSPGFEAPP